MEWMQSFELTNKIQALAPFFVEHSFFIILGAAVLVQWVAFQALLIHYQMFRANLAKPRTDLAKIERLERLATFHETQIEQVFEKYAALKKDLNQVARETDSRNQWTGPRQTDSIEASYISMGEINLKKRLESLKQS